MDPDGGEGKDPDAGLAVLGAVWSAVLGAGCALTSYDTSDVAQGLRGKIDSLDTVVADGVTMNYRVLVTCATVGIDAHVAHPGFNYLALPSNGQFPRITGHAGYTNRCG